jgi:hypothetical protein
MSNQEPTEPVVNDPAPEAEDVDSSLAPPQTPEFQRASQDLVNVLTELATEHGDSVMVIEENPHNGVYTGIDKDAAAEADMAFKADAFRTAISLQDPENPDTPERGWLYYHTARNRVGSVELARIVVGVDTGTPSKVFEVFDDGYVAELAPSDQGLQQVEWLNKDRILELRDDLHPLN